MKRLLRLLTPLLLLAVALPAVAGSPCYEMRTYYAAPGKLDALLARFREHSCALFEKHGITNIGYWVPIENPDHKLIYLLAHPSREARATNWKAFMEDPEWKAAREASEREGRLVQKVESIFLTLTDYSPEVRLVGQGTRVFELRTYTAEKGRLGALNARFRDHTIELFKKHGITNIGYWNLQQDQPGNDVTLIYLLAHSSREAARDSYAAFGQDPAWRAALKESEEAAGGGLTVQGGVKSLFLNATDFSPLR